MSFTGSLAACQIWYTIQALLVDALHLNPAMPGLSQSTSSACRQLNLSSQTEVVEQSVVRVPRTRTKLGECAFSVAGPSAWNALPDNIRCNSDTPSFKRQLKTHLFTIAFDV